MWLMQQVLCKQFYAANSYFADYLQHRESFRERYIVIKSFRGSYIV